MVHLSTRKHPLSLFEEEKVELVKWGLRKKLLMATLWIQMSKQSLDVNTSYRTRKSTEALKVLQRYIKRTDVLTHL